MIEVGDEVMVEVNGTLVFPEPRRVEAIHDYCDDTYVFVSGTRSAVRMENLVKL